MGLGGAGRAEGVGKPDSSFPSSFLTPPFKRIERRALGRSDVGPLGACAVLASAEHAY